MALNERQKKLINFCLSPRTTDEIATEFKTSYYTARKDVLYLRDLGVVRKSDYPNGSGKYTFQTSFKSGEDGGIQHINFSFRNKSYAPVDFLSDTEIIEGAQRAVRLIELAISKLLFEYDLPIKPSSEKEERNQPRSSMVRNRVKLATKYLRDLADLAEQLSSSMAWEDADFVRLFYGSGKYDKALVEKMQDELFSEAERWPEFQDLLRKMNHA